MRGTHHKLLAGFQTLHEYIQLAVQLLAPCTIFIRLARNPLYHISGKVQYSDWGKNIVQPGDEICFDSLYRNVIDKAFECDLADIEC